MPTPLRSQVRLLASHGWLLLWLVLALGVYWARGPLPIDETRYLSVAWEMWLRGDFLLPYLNGQPYAHKPPLLFWLIHAGWALTGVNEWWPRLISPLCALSGLLMTRALGRELWPRQERAATIVPWLLAGTLLWALWTTVTMFDMLLSALALVAAYGLLAADGERRLRGWALFAAACGLGILTKGPVALLYAVPPALLAPWWSKSARARPLSWYGSAGLALLAGASLALVWALPAAHSGGPLYAKALLWYQTTERLVESFAHARPLWWYLPWLPVILAPWALWLPLWRALASLRWRADGGARFCIAWIVPAFVVLSLVSQKQPYYLLPLLPGAALLGARALASYDAAAGRGSQALALLPIIIPVSLVMLLAALVPEGLWPGGLRVDMSLFWGAALACLGAVPLLRSWRCARDALIPVAVTMIAALMLAQVAVFHALGETVSVRPVAQHLAVLERRDLPAAYVGTYHGEFQFIGSLRRPLEVIRPQNAQRWLNAHPRGRLVFRLYALPPSNGPQLELVQPYRTKWIAVGSAGQLRALTGLLPVAVN